MMNLIPQLCNVCKYTVTKFRFNLLNRCWFSSNGIRPTEKVGVVAGLRKSDGIDEKYNLIYRPPNNSLLVVASSFCSVSSVVCPSMVGMYAFDYINGRNAEFVEQVSNLELVGMGTLGIMSMIAAYICTSIPARIYRNETEYIAVLPSYIPLKNQKFQFKKGDIEDRSQSKWARNVMDKVLTPGFETATFYKIKGKRILLTVKCFEKPIDFYEMFANTRKYIRKVKPKK